MNVIDGADGDGFQEYQTRSPVGYENMAWKDSGDSVVYPDGSYSFISVFADSHSGEEVFS
jgi:hypothetical protein